MRCKLKINQKIGHAESKCARSWARAGKSDLIFFLSRAPTPRVLHIDNRHMVEEEDVAFGKLAYCAPAPSRAKRGRPGADLAADERPWWAPERDMGTRTDATATEKRLVCKVYPKLNEWVGRWGAEDADAPLRRNDSWVAEESDAPLRRNDTWCSETENGPIRNIASQLLGLSTAAVGKYRE